MSDEQFEKIETLEGQPSGKAGGFEGLVERLAIAIRDAYSGGAECSTEADMRRARNDARTVLALLAKMGADDALVSAEELASMLWAPFATPRGIHGRLREQAAPILAAKDAELARLREEIERLRAEATPTDEQLAEEAARFVYGSDLWSDATNEQRMRVTKAAHYVICGGDDRSAFGTDVMLYAKGARRAGRPSATQSAAEAPSMNIMSPDD